MRYYKASNSAEIPTFAKFKLQCLHDSFLRLRDGVEVLEYGAGPVVLSAISASTKASEIVLADYCDKNLISLHQWLCRDSEAFDWTPYFSYVVQTLEGNDDKVVHERQNQVRKLVKAVIRCDITQDVPIEQDYYKEYDVVVCSLVLEGASSTHDEYCSNVAKLGKLVKPGGNILYYGIENKNGFYTVGDSNFPNLHVSPAFCLSAFENAGFNSLSVRHAPVCDPNHLFWYIQGTRNS